MAAPGSVDRWMAFELGRLNAGLVTEKKTLSQLLEDPQPSCRTREDEEHAFDPSALQRLAAVLTKEEIASLRLPITLFVSPDVRDSAYLSDPVAAKALRAVEAFGPAYPFRAGRMYLPHSLAVDMVRRSGGTLQFVFG